MRGIHWVQIPRSHAERLRGWAGRRGEVEFWEGGAVRKTIGCKHVNLLPQKLSYLLLLCWRRGTGHAHLPVLPPARTLLASAPSSSLPLPEPSTKLVTNKLSNSITSHNPRLPLSVSTRVGCLKTCLGLDTSLETTFTWPWSCLDFVLVLVLVSIPCGLGIVLV